MRITSLLVILLVLTSQLSIPGNGVKVEEPTPREQKIIDRVKKELCGRASLEGTFDCVKDDKTGDYKVIGGGHGALLLVDVSPSGIAKKDFFARLP